MKQVVVVFLFTLGLATDMAMGECKNCTADDNMECVADECKCRPGFYYSEGSDTCLEICDRMGPSYTEYPKSMIEQSKSFQQIDLDDASSEIDDCEKNCNFFTCRCVGFTVKRNNETDRGKCFLYDSTPLEVRQQWKEQKGRWGYYQRWCE